MRFFHYIYHHFFTREFLRFLFIGVVNTGNGVFFAWLFSFLLPQANLAFNCGYITSNLIAYILNSRFVFPAPLSLARAVKFMLSYLPNYIIQNIIVLIFHNWLDWAPIVSYLLAAVLGVPATFLSVKLFAFGRR